MQAAQRLVGCGAAEAVLVAGNEVVVGEDVAAGCSGEMAVVQIEDAGAVAGGLGVSTAVVEEELGPAAAADRRSASPASLRSR